MPRRATEGVELEDPVDPQAAWNAQEPCPRCGGRPGYNPATGVELKTGHTYNCLTQAQKAK
jgi:hypothetical protein